MSSDPVILGLLSRHCHQEPLQMYERVNIVVDEAEGRNCYICIGMHDLFFVAREMDKLLDVCDKIPYLQIEKAVTDTSTNRFFVLDLVGDPVGGDSGGRILIESYFRELVMERIGLCWQAEYMFRHYQVKKFPQGKATIGELLPAYATKVEKNNIDKLQVQPFQKYAEKSTDEKGGEFKHRGYSFFLREDFRAVAGLKTGTFIHDAGWTAVYAGHQVKLPPGIEIAVHVDEAKSIAELEGSLTGSLDLRTVATAYKQSLTQHLDQFYIGANGPYMKRMNRNEDVASWEGWEFFVRSKEHAFACVIFRRSFIPPICDTLQDLAVLMRCPAVHMTHESCEVLLDECRFVADSLASTAEMKTYREIIQARLDTLQCTEEGYRWTEGQLQLAPKHKRPAASKFVKSIVKVLIQDNFLNESMAEAEVFADTPPLHDPMLVPQEMLSDAEDLFARPDDMGGSKEGIMERSRRCRNRWYQRICRYLAHCVDGGILEERFTMATMLQTVGKGGSAETDKMLKSVVELLLHVRPNEKDKDWERPFQQVSIPLSQLLQTPDMFSTCSFNTRIMRLLLAENYISTEWKKKAAGRERGATYEKLLAKLLTSEGTGISLRTLICRQVVETTNIAADEENDGDNAQTLTLIPALVSVMQTGNLSLASCATAALVNISWKKENAKNELVAKGVMQIAVRQLKVKDEDLTLYTLLLLVNLTKTPHHRSIVVRYGGVPVLVDILTSSYQNLRKQRILTEACSVLGQLCNDDETRNLVSQTFAVVILCLLYIYDISPQNSKLKSKVLFALRQLCVIGSNKIKVGQHVLPRLVDDVGQAAPGKVEECLTNSVLLLTSLATVITNARAIGQQDRLEEALLACGLQSKGGEENKKHKYGSLIWGRVLVLKRRVREAMITDVP